MVCSLNGFLLGALLLDDHIDIGYTENDCMCICATHMDIYVYVQPICICPARICPLAHVHISIPESQSRTVRLPPAHRPGTVPGPSRTVPHRPAPSRTVPYRPRTVPARPRTVPDRPRTVPDRPRTVPHRPGNHRKIIGKSSKNH